MGNTQEGCQADPLYSSLDFWIGNWEVYENETLAGTNQIEKILNDCAVMEHWTDKQGNKGKSLFYIDNESHLWKQVWVADNAKLPGGQKEKFLLHEEYGKQLVFQGQYMMRDKLVLERTIISKVNKNEVSQKIEFSLDGGQHWESGFDGIYRRVKSYEDEIKEWQAARVKSLSRANGWTTLTGLVWMEEGKHSFGSSTSQDIVFPAGLPDEMGYFKLLNGKLSCSLKPDLGITINDKLISDTDLIFDADGEPSMLNWKSHFWYPIKRDYKYGFRVRDTLHPARYALHEIPTYPIDKSWKVTAKVIPAGENQKVNIENIVGISSDNLVVAILEFEKNGKMHQIFALDGGPNSFFLIIADQTTGEETYGGGRYLYVEKPKEGDTIQIDFNKTYNPPCVFTNYATCPLPPKENHLDIAITAGEKMVHILDH